MLGGGAGCTQKPCPPSVLLYTEGTVTCALTREKKFTKFTGYTVIYEGTAFLGFAIPFGSLGRWLCCWCSDQQVFQYGYVRNKRTWGFWWVRIRGDQVIRLHIAAFCAICIDSPSKPSNEGFSAEVCFAMPLLGVL